MSDYSTLISILYTNFTENLFMNKPADLSRLKWACRRGMLELDVLLGNFLNEAFSSLPIKDQEEFVLLLSENDQNLFMWLTGKEECPLDHLKEIIKKIKDHAKSRH